MSDLAKMRLMLGILTLFIVSMVASCNEVRYLVWGKTTEAKFDKAEAFTQRGRYGSTTEMLTVHYSFEDGDLGVRKEEDDVSPSWVEDQGGIVSPLKTVSVQYLPGNLERSRLKGHDKKWLAVPFVLCLAALAFFGIRFWIDFKNHERRSKASSALYDRR